MSDYPSDENLRPKRQRTGEGGMPATADEADAEVIFLSYSPKGGICTTK